MENLKENKKFTVEESIELITRGINEVIGLEEIKEKLKEGKQLTIKAGFDPTAPDIHLGHTVLLKKMRHFQILGHKVIFLIGDFTGRIGDPSGKTKTRPRLTTEDVLKNAETYKQQVFKILDPEKTIIDFNSKWLERMNFADVLGLTSRYTVAQMIERDVIEISLYSDGSDGMAVIRSESGISFLSTGDSKKITAEMLSNGIGKRVLLVCAARSSDNNISALSSVDSLELHIPESSDCGINAVSKLFHAFVGRAAQIQLCVFLKPILRKLLKLDRFSFVDVVARDNAELPDSQKLL